MENVKKDEKDRARRMAEKQKKEKARAKKLEKASVGKASVGDQKNDVSKSAGGIPNEEDEDEDDDLDIPHAPRELGINELVRKAKETFAKNRTRRQEEEVTRRTEAARVEILLEIEEGQRAYLTSIVHKEAIAQLKGELRAQTMEELKAEIYEQGVKDFLAINEDKMRAQLEEHLLARLNEYLPGQLEAQLKPEVERKLRQELEGEVRAQLIRELPAKLAPKIEERLRQELSAKLDADQRAQANLKRALPDDDFPRDNKRRRPSYDYDGEHSGDHEERVATLLARAFPFAYDDLPDYEDVVAAEEERAAAAPKEKVEDGLPAPNEDGFVEVRASHRQQGQKRGRPVEEDEQGDDDDFRPRKKLAADFWASREPPPPSPSPSPSLSPSPSPSTSPLFVNERRRGDNGVGQWEEVDGELEWVSAEERETSDEEEEEEEGVEMRGSSKEDAILLDSDAE